MKWLMTSENSGQKAPLFICAAIGLLWYALVISLFSADRGKGGFNDAVPTWLFLPICVIPIAQFLLGLMLLENLKSKFILWQWLAWLLFVMGPFLIFGGLVLSAMLK